MGRKQKPSRRERDNGISEYQQMLIETYGGNNPPHVEKKKSPFEKSDVFASTQQHQEQVRQIGVSDQPEEIRKTYDQLRGRTSISGAEAAGLLGLPRVGNSLRDE